MKIKLNEMFTFEYAHMWDNEVNGFVSSTRSAVVKGTAGWYRTGDAKLAASLAAGTLLETGKISVSEYYGALENIRDA